MRRRAAATRPTAQAAGSCLDPSSIARSDHEPSALEIAAEHPLVCADDREPRVRGRLLVAAVEQPLRSREPAAHRCHQRGVKEQVHRDAHGCTGRRDRVAGLCAHACVRAPTPRSSRRDGRRHRRPRPAAPGRPDRRGRRRRPSRGAHRPPPNRPAPPLPRALGTLISRRRNAGGYGRIELAHASGLRAPRPERRRAR